MIELGETEHKVFLVAAWEYRIVLGWWERGRD